MREILVLFVHLIVTVIRLAKPGGLRAVVAESVLVRHQVLIVNRGRKRASNLRASDRIITGLCTLLMRPARVLRSAIVTSTAAVSNRVSTAPNAVSRRSASRSAADRPLSTTADGDRGRFKKRKVKHVSDRRSSQNDPLRPLEPARREWRLPRSSGHSCTLAARQVIGHRSDNREFYRSRVAAYATTI